MKDDADQRLVSVLVDLVEKPADSKTRKAGMRPGTRRVLDIVAWSGLTNLALFACFAIGWNFQQIGGLFHHAAASAAVARNNPDPLAISRYELEDNELLTRGPQRQLKGPLEITLVTSAEPAAAAPAVQPELASAAGGAVEPDQGDGNGEITTGPEDPALKLKGPMLRKGQGGGDIEIGSFSTVSLSGDSSDCLDMAYGLLDDIGASRDKLKVLAASTAITVARICASNGSLVVTCRSDQITFSPRRFRPNENCTG